MKTAIFFSIYSCFSVILLLSCETLVDSSDLTEEINQIAIYSYISPANEKHSASIARVTSAFGKEFSAKDLVLTNAKVTLSDEQGNSAILSYNPENFKYEVSSSLFSVIPGKKYFLKATVAGQNFASNCKIPDDRITGVTTTFEKNKGEFEDNLAHISFNDIPKKENYYLISCDVVLDTINQSLLNSYYPYLPYLLTDIKRDGKNLTKTTNFNLNTVNDQSSSLNIKILNIEEILYKHFQSESTNIVFNPFVEPIIAPSNIEGDGVIGVFSGYRVTEKEFPIVF